MKGLRRNKDRSGYKSRYHNFLSHPELTLSKKAGTKPGDQAPEETAAIVRYNHASGISGSTSLASFSRDSCHPK